MSVNFYKHRDELVDAWKDVMNDRTKTDWALFGYEKQTNDLMVVDVGDGGIEQMVDELNSSRILYAFCKVIDPNTDINKYVLINWQGESAPLQRKGVCINHFKDIGDFFKGAHITINARTEDDVIPSDIINKVAKVSARVNVKDRLDTTENIGPIGTNYKRVLPQREISQTERENFWQKTQEDEQKRIEEERRKAKELRNKVEKERVEREAMDTQRRNSAAREREQQITKIKEAQQNAENSNRNDNKEKLTHNEEMQKDDDERRKRSERLRKERNEDAKAVISHGSIKNARALFEQNSSAGQMNSVKSNAIRVQNRDVSHVAKVQSMFKPKEVPQNVNPPKPKRVIETIVEPIPIVEQVNDVHHDEPIPIVAEKNNPQYDEPIPIVAGKNIQYDESIDESIERDNPIYVGEKEDTNLIPLTKNLLQDTYLEPEPLEDIVEEEQNWDEPNNDVRNGETAAALDTDGDERIVDLKRARALYDYQAADDTEISFDPDDIITHIEQIDEGWWQGMGPDGTYGLFPANYVELID